MKAIKLILGSVIVIAFGLLGIYSIADQSNAIQLKQMKVETLDSKLEESNYQLEKMNQQLDSAKKDHSTSAEKLKELERQRLEWEKQKQDYESKLQAKAAEKVRLAKASSEIANTITGTKTASASSGTCESWLTEAGITHPAAREIIKRESRCEPCIYNDGSSTGKIDCNYTGTRACGIPQSLPCSKVRDIAGCGMTNAVCQLRWMVSHVIANYGSWDGAIDHHNKYGWY